MGTPNHPLEIYVDTQTIQNSMDDRVPMNTLKAAYRSLRDWFGFGMAVHNLTPADYADILKGLEADEFDITTKLSSQHAPATLQDQYLGISSSSTLTQYTSPPAKHVSEILDSLIVAHQYVLSKVFGRGGLLDKSEVQPRQESEDMVDQEVWTWSLLRFSVRVPALIGMQDYLRVVHGPLSVASLEQSRSTLYGDVYKLRRNSEHSEKFPWRPTLMDEIGCKNEALCTVFTLLPSISNGLVLEGGKDIGVYVTITEEVIRGHSGVANREGRYYEWVAPVLAGDVTRRIRTYYLTIGCSIVVPTSFAVRIGSNPTQEVVIFAHTVRVCLPE